MDALGHSLTWQTHCFLEGGCGQAGLFGHTNGFGDFVLLDALGWPWPVHDCYLRRFELVHDQDFIEVRGSRGIRVPDRHNRASAFIQPVDADMDKHRSGISVIGTVTNVESRFIGRSFPAVTKRQQLEINKTLEKRRSFIVIAAGDGNEYGVFTDLDKFPTRFRDTVAAKLKPARLLNQVVFIATQFRVFRFDGH